MCLHWREEFKAGNYTLLVSSYVALDSKFKKARSSLEPQFGVYLDNIWDEVTTPYPKTVIDWPDTGAIELDELNQLVSEIKSMLKQGMVIDIACIMGHGRTGTLLACLLVELEGMGAAQAVTAVRSRHCECAVEFAAQERLVKRFASSHIVKNGT